MTSRVVITGLGVVSPIGIGVPQFWKSLLAGQSGITAITSFDPFPIGGYRSEIAGQIHQFSADQYLPAGQGDRVDRYAQFALVATQEAVTDAGLRMEKSTPTVSESSSEPAWAAWSWANAKSNNSMTSNDPNGFIRILFRSSR